METIHKNPRKMRIIGWVLSTLSILFLAFDAIGKLIKPAPVLAASKQLGYSTHSLTSLGIILLIATLLYAIPRVSVIGAILLTAYLGGAVASNFRSSMPMVSHVLFPIYIALMIWGGLYCRNPLLRSLFKGLNLW